MVLVLVAAALLGLLPAVLAKNAPGDWSCAPLTKITSSVEGCVTSSSYANGVWNIATSNSKSGAGPTKFCVISLSGEGIHTSKDFYVRARFSNSNPDPNDRAPGPFGGITFNMEDDNNGNYLMMRLKLSNAANVEMGKIVGGISSHLAQSKVANTVIPSGAATLEILVQDEQETVWIEDVLEESISSQQPFFVAPGHVGFGFQSVNSWKHIRVEGAEVCTPLSCTAEDGTTYSGGEQWPGEDGKTCTCSEAGINCACGDDTLVCPGGTVKWTDPEECESKCIKSPAYCVSSGDPHYKSFDGKYFDFHGECTYKAASCGDFDVYFKNIDLHNRAPTYTQRVELSFKGTVFAIERGFLSKVDNVNVQLPYIKNYNNGDRVEIINAGQLEIRLYNKGRDPSVRLRATNGGVYINAEMWLHGSCADITEGMCGNWNANPNDDLTGGSANSLGTTYQGYDEHCPAPPLPPDVCRDVGNLHDEAEAICSALLNDPFKQCNGAVPVGDRNGGPMKDCMTDVCNCYLDKACACAQFDVYATQCQNNGFNAANWRENVAYCPYVCAEPTVYLSDGATPVPTCLDKEPEKTGTERGCFCPAGQFLQDGVCVDASGCKCLYEGQFYENGAVIEEKAECQTCTCQDAGEMSCQDKACPTLNCEEDQLEARKDDECCNYCLDNWVVAENPDNQIKKGQSVTLTCEVLVEGVSRKNIVWLKDGKKITKGISRNKKMLTVSDADADDDATYTCQATKDGVTASDDFEVDVVMPAVCEHEDGTSFEEGTIYNPQETEECTCDAQGVHHCACIDDEEECEDPTPVVWFNDNCVKTCVPEPGHCSAAADPFYNTFDGSEFAFKGDCKYNFFSCGDVAMYADHEKNKASTSTKYIEVAFKTDVFKLEGNIVTLNGVAVAVPMHQSYKDGSKIVLEDKGTYTMTITQDGKDPLVYLQWDKVSSYSIDIHGSCKGFSTGMCGKWDDDKTNDLTGPEGDVLDSAEDFGTAWAQDDETDCPIPEPPPDMCEMMFQTLEKPGYEKHIANILKKSPFSKCADIVDQEPFATQAVQEICMCFDVACACPILEQLAGECKAKGIDTDGWQINFPDSKCKPKCPEGSVFKQRGPKPAPSCQKPNGGKKSQSGCFCPEGQMMEEGKCVGLDNCKCEYAGQLYDVGDKYEKGAECLDCSCVGKGQEECEDKKCKVTCGDDELEVDEEGECCPICLANWVEAVNPKPDAVVKEPLALTCRVNGVEVTKDNVKWFKFAPGMEDLSKAKRTYSISDDGLTLTIKKMDAKKEGQFKCVVEKDGKTSEGVFEVALPLKEKDLVEAEKEVVAFVEGQVVKLQCNKLDVITELWWTCNGKRLKAGEGNVRINNKKTYSVLTFRPAKLSDKGTCTCHAKGQGSEDSVDIQVGGVENEVTITSQVDDLTCKQGDKKACVLAWDIDSTIGKIGPQAVKICLYKNQKPTSCKFSKVKDGTYSRAYGKQRKPKNSGPYVAIVTVKGKEYISEPINFTVTKKEKKKREPKEPKEPKEKKQKKEKGGKKNKDN